MRDTMFTVACVILALILIWVFFFNGTPTP